jgi:serine/threonine protein kinase
MFPRVRAQAPERIGHYAIRRRLGSGAHGVVYEAFDEKLLRTVVLKTLHEPNSARDRVLSEAQLASAIDHANVCRAIYLGNENHPWLSANPAWRSLRGDRDFDGTLSELRQRHREAVLRWKRLSVVQG